MSDNTELAPAEIAAATTTRLQFELYCHEIAVRLSAYQLLDFLPDDDGNPQPYIWTGDSFAEPNPDESADDNWLQIAWDELPLVAELYERFGEPGIYFWPAYQTQTPLADTAPAVQQIYQQAIDLVLEYINRDQPDPQRH